MDTTVCRDGPKPNRTAHGPHHTGTVTEVHCVGGQMLDLAEHRSSFCDTRPTQSPYVVRLSASVPAVPACVFHALVIDEYLEMWAGDEDRPVRSESEPRSGGGLRMEFSRSGSLPIVVTGTFTHFEPGSMVTCMVSEEGRPDAPHCVVLMVHPEGDGTRVDLLHMALGAPGDAARLEAAWAAALRRLAALFTNASVTRHSA